jgi:hypothetical protein
MSRSRLTGCVSGDALADLARPLLTEALKFANLQPIKNDEMGQMALMMALQASINAAIDVSTVTTLDVVGAVSTAFAAWVTTVAVDEDEIEAAALALAKGVRRISPAMLAARRAH